MTEARPMSDWVVPDRLPCLSRGAHPAGSAEPCAMEAASWLAGEPWSDRTHSVHPVVAAVARWVNDTLDDHRRQQLWPLIIASLGTARPRRRVLALRLRLAARAARRRAAAAGDPVLAWSGILERLHEQSRAAAVGAPGNPPRPTGRGGWERASASKGAVPTSGRRQPYRADRDERGG